MADPRRSQSGFTLIEVVVAFTILALSVGVTSVIFGNGLKLGETADSYSRAIAVAQSKMAEFSVPGNLRLGQAQGVANGMVWQTTALPWFVDPTNPVAVNGVPQPDYYRISVRVAWGEGGVGQTLALESLRLASRGKGSGAGDAGEGGDSGSETGDGGGEDEGGDGDSEQ